MGKQCHSHHAAISYNSSGTNRFRSKYSLPSNERTPWSPYRQDRGLELGFTDTLLYIPSQTYFCLLGLMHFRLKDCPYQPLCVLPLTNRPPGLQLGWRYNGYTTLDERKIQSPYWYYNTEKEQEKEEGENLFIIKCHLINRERIIKPEIRVTPSCCNERKPSHSNEDPEQPRVAQS